MAIGRNVGMVCLLLILLAVRTNFYHIYHMLKYAASNFQSDQYTDVCKRGRYEPARVMKQPKMME